MTRTILAILILIIGFLIGSCIPLGQPRREPCRRRTGGRSWAGGTSGPGHGRERCWRCGKRACGIARTRGGSGVVQSRPGSGGRNGKAGIDGQLHPGVARPHVATDGGGPDGRFTHGSATWCSAVCR